MKTDEHTKYLEAWLNRGKRGSSDAETTLQAARHMATCPLCAARLRELAAALGSTVEDTLTCDDCQARLPDYIQTEVDDISPENFSDVQAHLELCPYCRSAYADVYEWVLLAQADSIPVSDVYPAFRLPLPSRSTWSKEVVRHAIDQGRQWGRDAVGALYILLGPGLQTRPALAWATKSSDTATPLNTVVLGEEVVEGWEIEVSAYADGDEMCRVEVALYRTEAPDIELGGVPVILTCGETFQTAETDRGGVAEFGGIPLARLSEVVVRVGITDVG